MLDTSTPTEITDATNARILAVSEDRIAGFLIDPFAEIARLAELDVATVHERLRAMLASIRTSLKRGQPVTLVDSGRSPWADASRARARTHAQASP